MIDVRKTWARFGWKPSEPKKPEVVSTRDLDEIPPSAEIIVWFNGREQVPDHESEVLMHIRYSGGDEEMMLGYYDSETECWRCSMGVEVQSGVRVYWAEVTGPMVSP
jgi:hypothetical protein